MEEYTVLMQLLYDNLSDTNNIIDCLYLTTNPRNKNMLLNRLRKNIANISLLSQGVKRGESMAIRLPEVSEQPTRVFTVAQLAKFNGKNGAPAYVAINGLVYDVTNIAPWGGAMHFGLSAGKDYTREFGVCHAGQNVLSGIKIVGKMVE